MSRTNYTARAGLVTPYYFVRDKSRRKKRTARDRGGECCANVENSVEKHTKTRKSAIRT